MGIHIDPSVITVYDEALIREPLQRQILNTDHRRDTHGTRKNGRMAVGAAAHRDDTDELIARNLSQGRGRQLLRNQYRGVGVVDVLAIGVLQITQNARSKISHIYRSLSQIRVLHSLEMPDMTKHDLTQRTLRPLTRFD